MPFILILAWQKSQLLAYLINDWVNKWLRLSPFGRKTLVK
jgi:hypothetical protein